MICLLYRPGRAPPASRACWSSSLPLLSPLLRVRGGRTLTEKACSGPGPACARHSPPVQRDRTYYPIDHYCLACPLQSRSWVRAEDIRFCARAPESIIPESGVEFRYPTSTSANTSWTSLFSLSLVRHLRDYGNDDAGRERHRRDADSFVLTGCL